MSNNYYRISNEYVVDIGDSLERREKITDCSLDVGAYVAGKGKPGIQVTIQNSGFYNGTAFYCFSSEEELEDFISALRARSKISATDEEKFKSKFNKVEEEI